MYESEWVKSVGWFLGVVLFCRVPVGCVERVCRREGMLGARNAAGIYIVIPEGAEREGENRIPIFHPPSIVVRGSHLKIPTIGKYSPPPPALY